MKSDVARPHAGSTNWPACGRTAGLNNENQETTMSKRMLTEEQPWTIAAIALRANESAKEQP